MSIRSALYAAALAVAGSTASQAATFTPTFDTPAFPGTQYDVTSTENAYYSTNYGITVDNSYLYLDSRDTFDGVGIANGTVANNYVPNQVGQVNFLDTTDYVSIDYLAILDGIYTAYDSVGGVIDSFNAAAGTNGTDTLSGGIISYITFTSTGGYIAISGMTYNYDGTTDGHNDDLAPVPLPASGLMLLGGLGAGLVLRRRRA